MTFILYLDIKKQQHLFNISYTNERYFLSINQIFIMKQHLSLVYVWFDL